MKVLWKPIRAYATIGVKPLVRRRKVLKFAVYATGSVGVCYSIDHFYFENAITRSLRTIYYSTLIMYDNKFSELPNHRKNADRLYELISGNRGLYIKLGQIISMQSSMFPTEFQQVLKKFLDDAPSDDWAMIEKLLIKEMGVNYQDLIEIDKVPIASASIAQVHKGIWKATGQEIAIKIQHDSIKKQMGADLFSYRLMMRLYAYAFDMPLQFISNYISTKLEEECDFNIEYRNTQKIIKLIESSSMKNDIYIPQLIYHSKRVLISEYINGDSFDKLSSSDGGNYYNKKKVMDNLITCFARQIFEWGFVHCDPHPGNFLLLKGDKLVILDHGLYVKLPDEFRLQYANLWKNLFELNFTEIKKIVTKWGIGSPELFSGIMLAKPQIAQEQMSKYKSSEEMNVFLKNQMKNFFANTDKFPLELVFLSRCIRMLQLLNLQNGSPSNRIGIMSSIAIKNSRRISLRLKAGGDSIRFNWKSIYNLIIIKLITLVNEVLFQTFKFKQFCNNLFGMEDNGFEVELDKQMNATSKRLGFNMNDDDV